MCSAAFSSRLTSTLSAELLAAPAQVQGNRGKYRVIPWHTWNKSDAESIVHSFLKRKTSVLNELITKTCRTVPVTRWSLVWVWGKQRGPWPRKGLFPSSPLSLAHPPHSDPQRAADWVENLCHHTASHVRSRFLILPNNGGGGLFTGTKGMECEGNFNSR